MPSIARLEQELSILKEEIRISIESRVLEASELREARNAKKLELERQICSINKTEYAVKFVLPFTPEFNWHVVGGFGIDAMLICDIASDPDHHARILFDRSHGIRLSKINDEVFETHKLYGKGLDICGAFKVENSEWLASTRESMEDHTCFDSALWDAMNHYLFRDKGGDFECLATGFNHRILPGNHSELLPA